MAGRNSEGTPQGGGKVSWAGKRQFREGNAQNVANIAGAGAATYNESGRTYFVSLNTQF
ncbi:hypothetical protein [Yersinia aldovae]|uniref:hypothetical protein n=1 Tax=Yersinia aldovae TaxID=29483 RepID=UPI000AA7891D